MLCKIIDGMFDDLYLHEKFNQILSTPLTLTNIANRKTFPYGYEGTHRLMGRTIFSRSHINRVDELCPNSSWYFDIFEQIEQKIKNDIFLHGIYINVQYYGCDGTTHSDSSGETEYTVLVMSNPVWNSSWGGEFQLMKDFEEVLETHKYVPGRVIIFPGYIPHRGLSPKEKYIYRTSIVYRIEIPQGRPLTLIED